MTKSLKIFIILGLLMIAVTAADFFNYISVPAAADVQINTSMMHTQKNPAWGVDFSQSQAEYLGLDWKETYSAIIDDLGAKNIKLHTNWDWVEGDKDTYFFNDIDWQIGQAEQKNVKIIYVLGMKTGRWPECHIPVWAQGLPEAEQQAAVLDYIRQVVLRYKDSKAITNWQVENEPLFRFGKCPAWYYDNDNFLKQEVALVKSFDPTRQIIISDSGENSDWFDAAKIGDIVGTTMYRNTWPKGTDTFNSDSYAFLNPAYYTKKVQTIQKTFGKNVICIELQAEPWASGPLMQSPLSEQLKSMNPEMFNEDVAFAKQTGLNKFYFWGVEWWYWLKTTQNQPGIWNEAKQLFDTNNI